jgi:hypothetical protein
MLSPSFEDAERSPPGEKTLSPGFEGVLTNLEHSLGRTDLLQPMRTDLCGWAARLQYTLGDSEGAVRFFLGMLRGDSDSKPVASDSTILGDFRQAFQVRTTATFV